MVGQLIRLKLQIIWNTIRRQVAVLVLSILGALYIASVAGSIYVALAFLARSDSAPEAAPLFAFAGPLVAASWFVFPILFASMDNSVDPARLAPYVGPSKRLAAALAAASAVGPGGLISALILLLPAWFALWRAHWLEVLGYLIGAVATLAIAVLWARAVGTWFAVRLNTSGKKDLVTLIGVTAFMVIVTPMGYWLSVLSRNFSLVAFSAGVDISLWTPFGAPFGVVTSLTEGAWAAAAIRAVISLVVGYLGWRAWLSVLRPVMSGYRGDINADAQRAIDEGRHLIDETVEVTERTQRVAQSSSAGLRSVDWFTRVGLGPRSASLAARTLRYWFVDPRLNMNLVLAIVFPILAILIGRIDFGDQTVVFTGIFLYLVPITTGMATGSLMQYDSTGAWIVISSGMSGREERRGRLIGSLPALLPQFLGYLIHDAAVGASAQQFIYHQVMGVVFFAGAAATTLVINARWVYPVQPPGTSPLATKGTGSFLMTMLLQLVGFTGTALLQVPSYVLLALAAFGFVPQWVAFVVAIAWSVLVLEAGVRVGGRVWDRYAVAALTTIRSWPGH